MIRRARVALRRLLSRAAPLACAGALLAAPAAAHEAGDAGRFEVNAMEYPWSAIGRVNAGGRGHCTGFLVSERRVLTAAHCLYDPRDGRWRAPGELHFVAGYQRDAHIIHAKVASYERSKGFRIEAGATKANAVADWALLTLARPIGRQAGWLGLQPLDEAAWRRLRRGEARVVQAGYREGFDHIMSVSLGCGIRGMFENGLGILHACDIARGDSGSPLMLVAEGGFRVAGMHVLNAGPKGEALAGALSVAIFHPRAGADQAAAAARRAGAAWGAGRAPANGSPAAAVPLATIERLLRELGHLAAGAGPAPAAARRAAIAAFEAEAGLPVTGEPSLALLARMIRAAR